MAIQFFRENQVNEIRIWVAPSFQTSRILSSRGFLKKGDAIHFFYAPLGNEDDFKMLLSGETYRVHFTYGDTDII